MKRLVTLLLALLIAAPAFAEDKLGGTVYIRQNVVGGGIVGGTCTLDEFVNAISGTGVPTCSAITFPPPPEPPIVSGPTPPTNPSEGLLWWNTTTGLLMVWDGQAWVQVSNETGNNAGTTPPPNPVLGQIWYNTSTTPPTLEVWDGTQWVVTHNGPVTSPTPPANPVTGMLWWDSLTGELFVWDGIAWVKVTNETANNAGPTPPPNPVIGQIWYDTSTTPATMRVWDGTQWVATSGASGQPIISDTPPPNPTDGQLWYNTSNTPPTLEIWDGQGWVVVSGSNSSNSGPIPPTNPAIGTLWYDTSVSPPLLMVWDGTQWVEAHGLTGQFAPNQNPVGGQNNYASIADAIFVGPITWDSINFNPEIIPIISVIGSGPTAVTVNQICTAAGITYNGTNWIATATGASAVCVGSSNNDTPELNSRVTLSAEDNLQIGNPVDVNAPNSISILRLSVDHRGTGIKGHLGSSGYIAPPAITNGQIEAGSTDIAGEVQATTGDPVTITFDVPWEWEPSCSATSFGLEGAAHPNLRPIWFVQSKARDHIIFACRDMTSGTVCPTDMFFDYMCIGYGGD